MRLGFGVGASDKVNLIRVKESQEMMRPRWHSMNSRYGSSEHVEDVVRLFCEHKHEGEGFKSYGRRFILPSIKVIAAVIPATLHLRDGPGANLK